MAAIVNALLKRSAFRCVPAAFRPHSSLITDLLDNMDKREHWDKFYQENNSAKDGVQNFRNFEWFFGFDAVRDLLLSLLRPQSSCNGPISVLDLGCGTSALGPSVYRHSPWPVHVTCADISTVAVQLMREHLDTERAQPKNPASSFELLEMDCCQLQAHFGPKTLDLIVDKGTTDALLRSRDGCGKAAQVLKQCLGALRESGSLLQFSDEDPDARLLWLESESGALQGGVTGVTVHEVAVLRGVCYYCYLITSPAAHL